jgi:hypothetical protein
MEQQTIKQLNIIYYSLGDDRYMRSLEIEGNKNIFVNSPLNLGFLRVNKEDKEKELKIDFEIAKRIIKRNGVKI